MPIHSHHRAERLEPEWMGKTAQELVAPVVVDDGFADERSKPRHARAEPVRHMPRMQRQIGPSSSDSHAFVLCSFVSQPRGAAQQSTPTGHSLQCKRGGKMQDMPAERIHLSNSNSPLSWGARH